MAKFSPLGILQIGKNLTLFSLHFLLYARKIWFFEHKKNKNNNKYKYKCNHKEH